jgi:hypothetical protein
MTGRCAPHRSPVVVISDLARISGCYAFARHEHLAPPIDRDHSRSGVPPRAYDTIVGVQLGEAVTVARDRPVIATISDRRRTLRSGQCTRNDYERLRDTFGAFMKASASSGYGNLPWLPR